jgi:DNA-directed RNA polymerase specialized sigma24 family protein
MNQFRSDANLSIWLVRIVDNKALERVRRRRRTVEITYGVDNIEAAERTGEINTEQTAWDQPGAAIMRAETRWLIDAGFDELPMHSGQYSYCARSTN